VTNDQVNNFFELNSELFTVNIRGDRRDV